MFLSVTVEQEQHNRLKGASTETSHVSEKRRDSAISLHIHCHCFSPLASD